VLTGCFTWAWQWMGKHVTLDKTYYSPFSKPLTQVCQWEPDKHPLPIIKAVVVFILSDNSIISNGSFCSHCLCCFVSEQLISSDKQPQKAITSTFIQVWTFWCDKHLLLLIELLHFLDSKTQFFTLQNFLNWGFFLHLMVSKNRCLRVSMSLNDHGSAACIALGTTQYKPDIKNC